MISRHVTHIETAPVKIRDADTARLKNQKMTMRQQRPVSQQHLGSFVYKAARARRIEAQVCIKPILGGDSCMHSRRISLGASNGYGAVRGRDKNTWVAVKYAHNIQTFANASEHDLQVSL